MTPDNPRRGDLPVGSRVQVVANGEHGTVVPTHAKIPDIEVNVMADWSGTVSTVRIDGLRIIGIPVKPGSAPAVLHTTGDLHADINTVIDNTLAAYGRYQAAEHRRARYDRGRRPGRGPTSMSRARQIVLSRLLDHGEYCAGRLACKLFGRFSWFRHMWRSCRGRSACANRVWRRQMLAKGHDPDWRHPRTGHGHDCGCPGCNPDY